MEERRENIMGTQPINRLLPSMAFPIMLSMLVQALYNVVDSVFVSMVSENALTSVSLAFPVQNLMIAVSVGTAVGINALLSRRLGEKNFEAANKVAENGIFVTVLSWAVFAVFGAACSGLFMGAFTQNAEILAGGTDYMWIVTVFSLGLFMSVTMERVLQVTGKTVYQMISQMTGAVVNIILDPVFIFGWLGLPAMGVAGAAWATVIGQFCGAGMTLFFNLNKNPDIQISFKGFRPSAKAIGRIYTVGLPSIAMQCVGSLMTFGMNLILMSFSATAVAVFGVYFKLQSFVFMPIFGLNNGMVPIISYNYGARRPGRVRKSILIMSLLVFGYTAVMWSMIILIPETLIRIFSSDAALIQDAVPALNMYFAAFIFMDLQYIGQAVFKSLNKKVFAIFFSLLRKVFIVVPLTYFLPYAMHMGTDGVFLAEPISNVIGGTACILTMLITIMPELKRIEVENRRAE